MINLASCYCIALPITAVAGFVLEWGIEGMMAAIACAPLMQAIILSVLAFCMDWERLATEASSGAALPVPNAMDIDEEKALLTCVPNPSMVVASSHHGGFERVAFDQPS